MILPSRHPAEYCQMLVCVPRDRKWASVQEYDLTKTARYRLASGSKTRRLSCWPTRTIPCGPRLTIQRFLERIGRWAHPTGQRRKELTSCHRGNGRGACQLVSWCATEKALNRNIQKAASGSGRRLEAKAWIAGCSKLGNRPEAAGQSPNLAIC